MPERRRPGATDGGELQVEEAAAGGNEQDSAVLADEEVAERRQTRRKKAEAAGHVETVAKKTRNRRQQVDHAEVQAEQASGHSLQDGAASSSTLTAPSCANAKTRPQVVAGDERSGQVCGEFRTPGPAAPPAHGGESNVKRRTRRKDEEDDAAAAAAPQEAAAAASASDAAGLVVEVEEDAPAEPRKKRARKQLRGDAAEANAQEDQEVELAADVELGGEARRKRNKKRKLVAADSEGRPRQGEPQDLAEEQQQTAAAPIEDLAGIEPDGEVAAEQAKKRKRRRPRAEGAAGEAQDVGEEDAQQQEATPAPDTAAAPPVEGAGAAGNRRKKKKQKVLEAPPPAELPPPAATGGDEQELPAEAEPESKKRRRKDSEAEADLRPEAPEAAAAGTTEAGKSPSSAPAKECVATEGGAAGLKVCARLPTTLDKPAIWKLFEDRCGAVTDVHLLRDWYTWAFRGVGFITFKEAQGLQAALNLDGTDLGGQKIRVNLAVDKTPAKGKCEGKGSSYGKGGKGQGQSKGTGKGRGIAIMAVSDIPPPEPNCPGVLVRGLSIAVTEADLEELFRSCSKGPTRVRLFKDRQTGESKGKAFVDFDGDPAGSQAAMRHDGKHLKGRRVHVEYGMPREERAAGAQPSQEDGVTGEGP